MDYEFLVRLVADYAVFPVVILGVWALVWKVPTGQRFRAYSRVLLAGLTAFLIAKLLAMT